MFDEKPFEVSWIISDVLANPFDFLILRQFDEPFISEGQILPLDLFYEIGDLMWSTIQIFEINMLVNFWLFLKHYKLSEIIFDRFKIKLLNMLVLPWWISLFIQRFLINLTFCFLNSLEILIKWSQKLRELLVRILHIQIKKLVQIHRVFVLFSIQDVVNLVNTRFSAHINPNLFNLTLGLNVLPQKIFQTFDLFFFC